MTATGISAAGATPPMTETGDARMTMAGLQEGGMRRPTDTRASGIGGDHGVLCQIATIAAEFPALNQL